MAGATAVPLHSTEEAQIKGDANGDGLVNISDVSFVINIILGKAALMAEIACGFEEGSETVLQDIFFKTTTESDDSLWYKGYVFNMSTKEDDNDSKNNIMLFRVFPVTDSLKNEWKLKEYS